jgi:alpha-D-xyloside xylohydrolase
MRFTRLALMTGCVFAALPMLAGPAYAAPVQGGTRAAVPSGLDANGHLLAVGATPGAGFSYSRLAQGVQLRVAGIVKNIIFYGPATVRVNANQGRNYWTAPSIVVVDRPAAVDFTVTETATALRIATSSLTVTVDKRDGALTFADPAGKVYTRERASDPQSVKPVTISGAPSYEVENRFTLKPDEAIYGFGFTQDPEVNRRGKNLLLVQTNIGIIIPVMMSTERYGIMWDIYSQMRFEDDAQGARLWAESAPGGVDYYFMGADSMDGVVRSYRKLTGEAPMYPKQAFGLFMSKERYPTQQRLLDVASNFRKERFPLDYIVQDWQYWGRADDGSWSGMIWDPQRYPRPEKMIRDLHDMNLKLMISIWPSVGNDTALAHDLDAHDLRFEPLHWISKKARIYDAYSPLGRKIYFDHVKSGLLDKGVDALWMDGTEVEVGTAMHDIMENIGEIKSLGKNALGDFTRYLNPYTLMTTQGTYDGQRATSDKRVLTLTRSAWAGAQRTGAASWSGDTVASWETLKQQIAGGVEVTVTGNPYWTQDTGGFFVPGYPGGEKNPHYRELFARWFQYAGFNPLMRVHGADIEREPYIFKSLDPQVYASLLAAVNLRYQLLPYIYGLSWQVTANGYTMMRPISMDFPDDRRVPAINDAFMFGSSLLVHPVTRVMYRPMPAPAPLIPASALLTPDGKPGLAGQYFQGNDFDTPAGKVVDATIDKQWPSPPLQAMPAGLTSLDHFSARWEGKIVAPEDGDYAIGLEGDDGFRLFLDGKKVIDDWTPGPMRAHDAKVTLKKGQQVTVRIDYFQDTFDRNLRLTWRTPTDIAAAAKQDNRPNLTMQTYLPKGADWYDFWSNQRYVGGTTAEREAPLDIIPLYVRAGSIVPMGPVQQYATEKPDAPYEIRVYPGADARFTVYEDDNETYAYEKGQRATYDLVWNDARRTLTIGARNGSFPGMVAQRKLDIAVAGSGGGFARQSVVYDGKALSVVVPASAAQ